MPLKPQLPNQLSKSGTLAASENGDGQRRVMRPLARPRLHNHASMVGPPRNLSVRSTEVQEPVPCTFSGGVRLEAGEKTERQNPDFRGTHFVDQNLHSSGSTTSDLARSRAAIAAERLTVERLAAFQLVNECLKGNARAAENSGAAQNFRVLRDYFSDRQHGGCPLISLSSFSFADRQGSERADGVASILLLYRAGDTSALAVPPCRHRSGLHGLFLAFACRSP